MRSETRRLRLRIVLAALVLLVAAAATMWVGSAEPPSDAAAVPQEIPDSARALKNPSAGQPESIANGKLIYSSQCAMCHGAGGEGKGDLAVQFKYQIPDFTTAEAQRARTDGEWFYILTHGHGKMTGEGERLSDKIRWDLVSYLRSLGPSSGG